MRLPSLANILGLRLHILLVMFLEVLDLHDFFVGHDLEVELRDLKVAQARVQLELLVRPMLDGPVHLLFQVWEVLNKFGLFFGPHLQVEHLEHPFDLIDPFLGSLHGLSDPQRLLRFVLKHPIQGLLQQLIHLEDKHVVLELELGDSILLVVLEGLEHTLDIVVSVLRLRQFQP
eukprot:CAMPEP_0170551860 /NCGR_PEP_ID=MMETSP0211-20121228/9858_1 /TAXON_ID=311385 /ORGANISM="Pseudokeronopsis sp., Strain OXSARD2" /LENGTH=173 /DNA_ID=CAMNT_0010859291 /DNA_START=994 /DNA_END=1515 /DNA_ORIENTATION=-